MRFASAGLLAAAAVLLVSCATPPRDYRPDAVALMKRDFHARGIAGMDRLQEDAVQATCNQHQDNPPQEVAAKLEKDQFAAIKWPADGKLLGDWRNGEKIAQDGRGMAWNDKGGVGGSCYNCHQIGPATTSFGTIGPSLHQFGKKRGYGAEIQRYAYGKIYNAKAYNLCSQMPRFGHVGALTEQQMRDLTALLMDPASPVNQ
ncbi:MAG: sulfur oxidation c-type cytochrome SoxX [Burkholderiales bacterium]